jgi:hypothetical protein
MPQGLDAQHSGFFDLDQCSVPSMSTKYGSEASLDADLTYAMNQSTDEAWRRDPRL